MSVSDLPIRTPRGDRLSRAVSAVAQLAREHRENAPLDAAFDAGEWSGPAHDRALNREATVVLQNAGLSSDELGALVTARTSGRWAYFNLYLPEEEF